MSFELDHLRRELAARGVELWAEGDKLQLRAPRGTLDADLQRALRTHKQALLDALRRETRTQAPPGRLPLSSTQRQLWLGEQLDPGSEAHLLVVRGQLRGPVERDRLARALAVLIARHESLRTSFEVVDGVPWQRIHPPADVPVPLLGADADRAAMTIALDRAPLVRVQLIPSAQPGQWALELRAHHLIVDGGALERVLDELGRAYAGEALAPVAVAPRELAARAEARLRSPAHARRLAAWIARLGDARAVELPSDRARSPAPGTAGGRVDASIPAPLWASVQACARAHDTTAFVVVASAVALVCQRWTGRERIWLGVPHSNRDDPARARAVASLVETTVLELDGRGDPSVARYLARARDAWLACLDHADLPLDRVVAGLGVRGLPDLTVNFIPFAALGLELPGVEVELDGAMPGARFDLTVYAYPRAGALDLRLAYRSALFERERIAAFAAQLRAVLAAFVTDDARVLSAIALDPGRTAARPAPPRAQPAPALAARIDAVPADRVAARGPEGERSYASLRAAAIELSQGLRALELEPGARVAIYAERRATLACALLGIWDAGFAAVILDRAHPPARLLSEARAAEVAAWIALASPPAPIELREGLAGVPVLDVALGDGSDLDESPAPSTHAPVPDAAVAWLPFTSGTTGQPRGVIVEHGALRRTFAWYLDHFAVAPDERFALLAGLGHDPVLRDLLIPLCAGASVCVPPDEPARMGAELGPWLRASAVTSLHLTPPLARVIAAAEVALPDLRRVIFAGAPLRGTDLVRWRALAPNAALYNGYGASESPQLAAVHRCTRADERAAIVALGRGVAGTTLELVGANGQLAAIVELGEIVIAGPNLARAYLPTQAPRDSSLGPRLDARLDGQRYSSGDLGRLRADGVIEFAGRDDRQLSVRGHRIAAAEVEAALLADDAVVEASVGAREDELVAALVGPHPSELPRLRAGLAARLPAAMIPSRIACVDALPLTANAKLDVEAAAALARSPAGAGAPPIRSRPCGELELALAALWSSLLGVAEVGREDDFFALGGHSLLGVELIARLHATLELRAPVALVFERPVLADMAAALAALRLADDDPPRQPQANAAPDDDPNQGDPTWPASPAQARLWLLQRLDPAAPQLILDHDLELDAALDLDRLDAALVALERRHEPLRTQFRLTEAGLAQLVARPRERLLERRDGPPAPPRFDLERGPVWRALAWTEAGRARLRIQLHHIAGDAAAMAVLIRDLVALYRGRPLAPLALRYRDLARWQRARAARDDPALAQLCAQLDGLPPLALPLAFPRPTRQRYRGARVDRRLDPATSAALVARCEVHRATIFMAGLTALFAVLARWAGARDLAVGTPVGLRPHPAAAALVGPFLNLAIVRASLDGETSLVGLLDALRPRVLATLARAHVPFERVLDRLAPDRALDRTPLVQVLFNMVDGAALDRAWAELGATRRRPAAPTARYELAVYAELDDARGLGLTLVYDRDLFCRAQMDQLGDHLVETLATLARAPDTRVSAIDLRRPREPKTPPAPATTPQINPVFETFEAIVADHGERMAIVDRDGELSYAELGARARELAARLSALAPGARIGLLCEHDASMIAAMLAALARGLVYVPLDPRLPPARLRELARDAELAAIASVPRLATLAAGLVADPASTRLLSLEPPRPGPAPIRAAPRPTIDVDAPAYILYTSGSTGRPKGVVQSQRNLATHARRYAASVDLGPGEAVAVVANFAFDAAIMDIYGGLLRGARLCLIDLGDPRELAALAERVHELGVDLFHATPTVVRELVAQLDAGGPRPALRCVVLGGEEARAEDAHALRRHFGPDCVIVNGLGPTECTVAIQHRLEPDDPIPPGDLAIGRPVAGIRAVLRTPVGEQVAICGVGELVIEGHAIARGYWRRPTASAAAFSTLPDGRRRYASGDLARRDPDGTLRFVGRRDAQVQIRGRRVELGEVEARLRDDPAIREAGVSLRGDAGQPWLAAHVCLAPEAAASFDEARTRAALAERLPPWMVPRTLVVVPTLTKTATGKLDRRALAAAAVPDSGPGPDRAQTRAPASLAAVRGVWSRVLGLTPPSDTVDLFGCGGDSLAAVRLHRALVGELGLELELAELFEGASIVSLAARLDGAAPARPRGVILIDPDPAPPASPRAPPATKTVIVLPPGAGPRLARPLVEALAATGERAWILRCPSVVVAAGERGTTRQQVALAEACAAPLASLADPLRLLGISNGGLLALLIASRRPTAEVALLDTLPPSLLAADPWPARSSARRRAAFLAHWAGLRADPGALAGPLARALEVMRAMVEAAGDEPELPSLDELERLYVHYDRHADRVWRALATLEPDALGRPRATRLFAAQGPPALPVAAAWRSVWPELAVHAVAGDHLGMIAAPHVSELVATLREALTRPELAVALLRDRDR